MKKGIIVGKFQRSYEKSGQTKFVRELHMLWDEPNQQQDGMIGQKVEPVYVRFPIDNLSVGDYVGVEYEPGFAGRADVVDVAVLGRAEVSIKRPEIPKGV